MYVLPLGLQELVVESLHIVVGLLLPPRRGGDAGRPFIALDLEDPGSVVPPVPDVAFAIGSRRRSRTNHQRRQQDHPVNAFTSEEVETYQPLRIDPDVERDQVDRLKRMRDRRDGQAVDSALAAVGAAASGSENVLYPLKRALASGVTVGEICDVLRRSWGVYESTHLL